MVHDIPLGWLDDNRKDDAWNALRGIGRLDNPQPAHNNHGRERLDQRALIIEGQFDSADIQRSSVVAVIAQAIGRPEGAVNAVISYQIFGEGLTWRESWELCRTYIHDNLDEWQGPRGVT